MKLHEFDMMVSRWADEVHNIVILRLIQSAASGQYVPMPSYIFAHHSKFIYTCSTALYQKKFREEINMLIYGFISMSN